MVGTRMKTRRFLILLCAAALGAGAGGPAASAATKQDKPAGFIAKHASNGVTCKMCHGAGKKEPVDASKCTTCHDTKDLAEKTAAMSPANPHDNRHFGTEGDCNGCHHQHKASENRCAECHKYNFQVP